MENKNSTGEKKSGVTIKMTWGLSAIVLVGGLLVLAAAYGGMEYYTSKSSFCGGSCHTMTEQYEAWQSDLHYASNNDEGMQAECIECHFLPGEKSSLKAKYQGLRHLFAYLFEPEAPLPIHPVVPDGACLQSGCHDKGELGEQEIQYTDKVRFKHEVHLGDEALEGQQLACDTCHIKVSEEKHFEVPADVCHLCHLKREKPTLATADMGELEGGKIIRVSFIDRPSIDFIEGVSRCDMCHTIPTESLQNQISEEDDSTEPITHQSILEADVACESCHFDVARGTGEVITGNVMSSGCLKCHNHDQTLMATAGDGKKMHDDHVATRKADCFDCHTTIEHKNRTDHLDFVREDCQLCHIDEHKYQKLLLAGTPVNENLSPTPNLMFEVNTNCMGCHLEKTTSKGHAVRTASGETCVACHTERHSEMLDDWRTRVEEEVTMAEELEQEALEIFEELKSEVKEDVVVEVEQKLANGSELLNIVRVGNGVHNKKYAIMVLDEAFVNFEESIDLLENGR
ncbi:MAG: NapC/NirT family cytochrome c [Gammaproteobacteria bacterium]|nr:NapC/NirT family cytochrome c [Gammaproteobacteria bacterium]